MTDVTENSELQIEGKKIYKDKAIYLAAYLGGPLAAGYIIASNFKAFGDLKNYKKSIVIAIIATIAVFGLAYIIPNNPGRSNHLLPISYTIIAYFLMRWFQGKQIDAHIAKGGLVYSWGRVLLVSVIGLSILLAVVLPILFFPAAEEQPKTYIYNFKNAKNEIMYFPDHVEKAELNTICHKLATATFFDSTASFLFIDKKDETFQLYFPIKDLYWEQQDILTYYKDLLAAFRIDMSKNEFEIILCDSAYNEKKVIK